MRLGFRLFAGLALALFHVGPLQAEVAFLEPGQAFRVRVSNVGAGELLLHWDIAPGYYLYRDRLKVDVPAGQAPAQLELPRGETKADPNFGAVTVYHHSLDLPVHAGAAGSVDITWQGCGEQGICYPPQHRTVSLQPRAATGKDNVLRRNPLPSQAPGHP